MLIFILTELTDDVGALNRRESSLTHYKYSPKGLFRISSICGGISPRSGTIKAVFETDRNRKCWQLYFLFFRFWEGSVFARACSSDLSLSVKFSVDFKAEVQRHLLHPLPSLHQIQKDGTWLPYHGYLHRRSCRLHYWKRFQISNCNNSYNCQATTTKNIFNHICTCIISRQRYIVGWFHTIFT